MPPGPSSVALQWNLDTTVGTSVKVAAGILQAATSDNVQPLAIMACEAFGANLAMCTETCLKVEKLAKRKHISHVVHYLQIQIGYSANDTAHYLASTEAGVRFLGLAAVLLQSHERSYPAAELLHSILLDSAPNKQLLPTLRQLRDLLESLVGKLSHSGFGNTVLGWGMLLRQHVKEDHTKSMEIQVPSSGLVHKLIQAMAELQRLGAVIHIRVEAAWKAMPWLAALIQWCLGTPPSIMDAQKGTYIFENPISQVLLQVDCQFGAFKIQTFRRISGINELFWTHRAQFYPSSSWHSMVSASSYFSAHFREIASLETGQDSVDDLMGTLLYLADNIPDRVRPSSDSAPQGAYIFPEHRLVVRLVLRLFTESYQALTKKQFNLQVYDSTKPPRTQEQSSWHMVCSLFTEVLTFSLLANAHSHNEDILIACDSVLQSLGSYIGDYRDLLSGLSFTTISPDLVNSHVQAMLGISPILSRQQDSLIISGHGQVSYLTRLETMTLGRHTLFQRCVQPGLIIYENETYPIVREDYLPASVAWDSLDSWDAEMAPVTIKPVKTAPFELAPDVRWTVAVVEDHLEVNSSCGIQPVPLASEHFKAEECMLLLTGPCGSVCPDAKEIQENLVYCEDAKGAVAEVSEDLDRPVRVLHCRGSRAKALIVAHALGWFTRASRLYCPVFLHHDACLWCTCHAALKAVESWTANDPRGDSLEDGTALPYPGSSHEPSAEASGPVRMRRSKYAIVVTPEILG